MDEDNGMASIRRQRHHHHHYHNISDVPLIQWFRKAASERSWFSQLKKSSSANATPNCDIWRKIVREEEEKDHGLRSIKGRNVSGQMLNSSPWHHTANMKLLLITSVVRDRLTSAISSQTRDCDWRCLLFKWLSFVSDIDQGIVIKSIKWIS